MKAKTNEGDTYLFFSTNKELLIGTLFSCDSCAGLMYTNAAAVKGGVSGSTLISAKMLGEIPESWGYDDNTHTVVCSNCREV